MKAGVTPDAYLSCDQRFLDQVSARFHPAETLTENPMVIVTPRGNPADVRSVADFKRQGLRIGLAHPEKSALGHLTELILQEADELDAIRASGNWVQEAPQGDFLVNALRTGALDAAIVYASNAAESRDALEIIDLDTGSITARQPWAIARISDHQQTLQRLHDALVDERSVDRFRSLGFNWLRPVDDEGSSRK